MALSLSADFIIVGGGSAGCVLAARLSESGEHQVILVESGGYPDSERFRVPGAAAFNLGNPRYDWCYQTPPDPTMNGRRFDWSAGRVLGGGSSINGLVYIRGIPADFARWDRHYGGGSGWTYGDILPYFIKAEAFVDRGASYLGASGPLPVGSVPEAHPLLDEFIRAGIDAGYRETDLNGPEPEGLGPADSSQRRGRRGSTYEAYLKPILKRDNLRVLANTEVSRVVVEEGIARGVEVVVDGKPETIRASREVILSAGAIGSPALLLRSGIGDSDELARRGITPAHQLPGVGRNLQEHSGSGVAKYVDVTTLNSQMGPLSGLGLALRYYLKRSGPLASPIVQGMGFVKTSPDLEEPDIQLHFLPFGYIITQECRSAMTAFQPKRNAMMITVTLCQPKSRGRVQLDPSDPAAKPVIEHQLFSDEHDLRTLVKGLRVADNLYRQPSLRKHVEAPCTPDRELHTDAEWEHYIRSVSNIAYHFCGTCKMGRDEQAVVDASLKVVGLGGLRVVDASIMPTVTSGNTNATVIAVAEKAADMILSGQ